jgi:hypothetical protein
MCLTFQPNEKSFRKHSLSVVCLRTVSVVQNDWKTVNSEMQKMWKESAVAYFKVFDWIPRNTPVRTVDVPVENRARHLQNTSH